VQIICCHKTKSSNKTKPTREEYNEQTGCPKPVISQTSTTATSMMTEHNDFNGVIKHRENGGRLCE